jgi:hypothetical protein
MLGTYHGVMTHNYGINSDFLELTKHIQASQKINADMESCSADEFMILFLIMQIYVFILKQNQASLIHQIP